MTSCHLRRRSRQFTCRSTGRFTSSWWTCSCINPTIPPRRITPPGPLMTRSSSEFTGKTQKLKELRNWILVLPHKTKCLWIWFYTSVLIYFTQKCFGIICFAFQSGHFRHSDVRVWNAGGRAAQQPLRQAGQTADGPPTVSSMAGNVIVYYHWNT